MSATVISAAHEFVDQVRATFEAEVQVAYDALLQAGWPSTRIAQAIERIAGGGLRCTLSLTRGIEVPDDLPVFVAEWRFTGGVVAGSERRIQITGVWLVDPIPTPHAPTIRAANPPPQGGMTKGAPSGADSRSDGDDRGRHEQGNASQDAPAGFGGVGR